MSESFEKWWNDQIAGAPVGVFATEEAMAKAAYLAGQASVEERVKELEQERDEAVRQWERFERMAGDNWAALKAQAGERERIIKMIAVYDSTTDWALPLIEAIRNMK